MFKHSIHGLLLNFKVKNSYLDILNLFTFCLIKLENIKMEKNMIYGLVNNFKNRYKS